MRIGVIIAMVKFYEKAQKELAIRFIANSKIFEGVVEEPTQRYRPCVRKSCMTTYTAVVECLPKIHCDSKSRETLPLDIVGVMMLLMCKYESTEASNLTLWSRFITHGVILTALWSLSTKQRAARCSLLIIRETNIFKNLY